MEVKRIKELFEIGESRGDLLDDDIEILRRSERFRRQEVIEMEKNVKKRGQENFMVSLMVEEEALVEEWFEEDEDGKKNGKEGLFNLKA
ncbi:hypothetical protein Tco_0571158 [Tanacetum coccineum]